MYIVTENKKEKFVNVLQKIDFDALPISDYNKKYIRRILPKMAYYADVYARTLGCDYGAEKLFSADFVVVDYGGGHGFLSIFLKMLGMHHVIYVDKNPQSVEAAKAIKDAAGYGADVFICGEEEELIEWCRNNEVNPRQLIGLDVIEHIYDLEKYLGNLFTEFKDMHHVYTTASVEKNQFKSRRLKKQMRLDEYGTATKQGYFDMRKQFIMNEYPSLSDEEADRWAEDTRGMNYHDIAMALSLGMDVHPKDSYNTCDPETGNWTERILSEDNYFYLARKFGSVAIIFPGNYNVHNKGIKKIAAKFLNLLIKHHNLSKRICPFVYIEMLSPNRWGKFDDEMVRFINRLFSKDKEVTNEKENSDDNMTND